MKKATTIMFVLSLVMAKSAFGQFSLNFTSGINHSTCKFEKLAVPAKGLFGYFFGFAPNYQIAKKVQLQIDFQYSLKGFNIENTSNSFISGFIYRYLDVISEVEYQVYNFLALGIGTNYGLKLQEQFKVGDGDWSSRGGPESSKSTDFGLTGKLKINHKNLFGFIRYNMGLRDINNVRTVDLNGQEIEGVKQFNRNLQFGLGYKLNL